MHRFAMTAAGLPVGTRTQDLWPQITRPAVIISVSAERYLST
jgi:hypothetical protein